ncbi:MAG: DNA polymerase III subunit delta, partial [Bacteroidota bacterium]
MASKSKSLDHYRSITKEIQSGSPSPVYALTGEESFFLDRIQGAVIELVPESVRDFNLDLLYGKDVTPARLMELVRSYPMMSDRRVVIVREFRSVFQNVPAEEDVDLIPYFKNPNPQTILLLMDEKGMDKRTKLGQLLAGSKGPGIRSADFPSLNLYQLPDWVESWLQESYGKSIEPEAIRLLLDLVGSSLQLLSTELDKVCSFVDNRERIMRTDIEAVVGSYRQLTVIELKEALLTRSLDRSMQVVERMLQQAPVDTGEMLRTLGFFYSVFGNIWQIVRLREKG